MAKESDKDIDFALMREVQHGDMVAYTALVDRYKHRLMAVVDRTLCSVNEAEEVVQETFVRAYQHRQSFDFEHCVSTWLYSICLNLAENKLRKRKRSIFFTVSKMPRPQTRLTIETTLRSLLPHALEVAIRRLPHKVRVAFLLRDSQEMSYEQVAAVLNIPVSTVRSRVNRARTVLRRSLHTLCGSGAGKYSELPTG